MRKFSTAGVSSDEAFDDSSPIEFMIDDDVFTAVPPTQSQFALFMASQSERRDVSDRIAGVIDFFDDMLADDEMRRRFRKRLLDREDPLSFEVVSDVMDGLMEEWMDRPTVSGSDSSSSPPRTGTK